MPHTGAGVGSSVAAAATCPSVAIRNGLYHSPRDTWISGRLPAVHKVTMQSIRATYMGEESGREDAG